MFYQTLAEVAGEYLKKGALVYLEVKLRTREWMDKEGIKHNITEIGGNLLKMLGKKPLTHLIQGIPLEEEEANIPILTLPKRILPPARKSRLQPTRRSFMNVILLRRMRNAPEPSKPTEEGRRAGSMLLHALWLVVAISWPLLRWILALDVTFQFLRTLIGFIRQGLYLDWTFLLHFAVYVFLICFVTSSWKR